jgi:hypothetical protein
MKPLDHSNANVSGVARMRNAVICGDGMEGLGSTLSNSLTMRHSVLPAA